MTPPVLLRDVIVARDGRRVLDGLSLDVAPGERLAILGANGAGKTTLLRTIVGLERPEAGEVRLFGATCRSDRDFRPARLRLGFLFQDSDDQLVCPTVIEDVAFGPLNAALPQETALARARDALAALGIAALADRVTHRLSEGEKRLVCLAGLLVTRPEVLLLDEPTNGIDDDNRRRLGCALAAYHGAILLVSHDDAFVEGIARRTLRLTGGRLTGGRVTGGG